MAGVVQDGRTPSTRVRTAADAIAELEGDELDNLSAALYRCQDPGDRVTLHQKTCSVNDDDESDCNCMPCTLISGATA